MSETAEATPPRKPGPVRSLTREQIVRTALDVMATGGLKAVSFGAISLRLGVDRKALYTYFRDRDDLLNTMFDTALTAFDLQLPDDEGSPEEQLIGLFVSIRRAFIANADLLLMTRPTYVGADLGLFERMWSQLTRLVPDEAKAGELYMRLLHHTVGSAISFVQYSNPQDVDPAAAAALLAGSPRIHAFWQAITSVDLEASFAATLRLFVRAATDQ